MSTADTVNIQENVPAQSTDLATQCHAKSHITLDPFPSWKLKHTTMFRTRSKSYDALVASRRKAVEDFQNILENTRSFEKSIGNKPLFTRDVLQQAADDMAKARDPKTCKDKIIRRHIRGGGSSQNFAGEKGCSSRLPRRSSYFLQSHLGKHSPYTFMASRPLSFADNYLLAPDDHDTNPLRLSVAKMTPPTANLALLAKWQRKLKRSRVWHTMKKLIRTTSVKIDNIVCLAFGLPNHENAKQCLNPRKCAQHLVACLIAEYLSARDGTSKPKIVAYDPAYSVADMQLLSSLPHPITIVSDPHNYLSITPNSLVMCIDVQLFVPVFEIIADSLFPSGPAAMFCNELFAHPWHANGQNAVGQARAARI